MHKVVYRGGANGNMELVATEYSDRNISEFVKACETLNLPELDALGHLNTENEVEFVKAFFPDFDPQCQLAVIGESKNAYSGFINYFIQLWKSAEDL